MSLENNENLKNININENNIQNNNETSIKIKNLLKKLLQDTLGTPLTKLENKNTIDTTNLKTISQNFDEFTKKINIFQKKVYFFQKKPVKSAFSAADSQKTETIFQTPSVSGPAFRGGTVWPVRMNSSVYRLPTFSPRSAAWNICQKADAMVSG